MEGKDYNLWFVVWVTAVWGNKDWSGSTLQKKRFLHRYWKESSLMECSLLSGQTDGKSDSEVEQQEQPAASSTVIEFSLGQQGLNSLLQMETALFPLFTDDVMGTGCGRGKLYSWWTSLNCQDCREGEDQNLCVSRSVWEQRRMIAQHWTTKKMPSLAVGFICKGWYLELA